MNRMRRKTGWLLIALAGWCVAGCSTAPAGNNAMSSSGGTQSPSTASTSGNTDNIAVIDAKQVSEPKDLPEGSATKPSENEASGIAVQPVDFEGYRAVLEKL